MSDYFENFPICSYKFADNQTSSTFPNLSSYVDVLDTTRTADSFYTKQYIQDYDRPDTMSYKLYGTVDYHWTFFYMNDELRRSGWPLAYNEIQLLAMKNWPNQTARTNSDISTTFLTGQQVSGSQSGASGTVVSRNLDLGQLVIKKDSAIDFLANENITYQENQSIFNLLAYNITPEYNAVHHFEDADGVWRDIDPQADNSTILLLSAKTNLDMLVDRNETLKAINVLTKESIGQVVGQWKSYMKSRGLG